MNEYEKVYTCQQSVSTSLTIIILYYLMSNNIGIFNYLSHGFSSYCSWIHWYRVVGPLELELGQKDENNHHDKAHS